MKLPPQQGFFTLEYLLSFPILLILLALIFHLVTTWHQLLHLAEAYYTLHKNARTIQHTLRTELKNIKYTYCNDPDTCLALSQYGYFRSHPSGMSFFDQTGTHKKSFFLYKKNNHFDLYIKTITQPAREIAENVEKIKFLYGIAPLPMQHIQFYTVEPASYTAQEIKIIQVFLSLKSQVNDKKLTLPLHITVALA